MPIYTPIESLSFAFRRCLLRWQKVTPSIIFHFDWFLLFSIRLKAENKKHEIPHLLRSACGDREHCQFKCVPIFCLSLSRMFTAHLIASNESEITTRLFALQSNIKLDSWRRRRWCAERWFLAMKSARVSCVSMSGVALRLFIVFYLYATVYHRRQWSIIVVVVDNVVSTFVFRADFFFPAPATEL